MSYRTTSLDYKGLVALMVLIISICSNGKLIGQSAEIIHIDSIPAEGILLDRGWKYHIGDNPEWAKPDYDDNQWQSVDPAQDIYELHMLWKDSVVWFRIHLYLEEDILQEQLVMQIQQSGASELYVNGNLFKSFGIFNTDASKSRAYDPLGKPLGFPQEKSGLQIIAVQYILQPGINYKNIFAADNYVLQVRINTLESYHLLDWQKMYFMNGPGFSIMGIFFILTILHLSFYWFNRKQKANLFFSLFSLLTMIGFLFQLVSFEINWVEDKFFYFYLAACLILIGNLFMFTSIYFQLEQKRGGWFFMFVFLLIINLIAIALPGYLGWEFAGIFFQSFVHLEVVRITFLGIKRKQRGAWILAFGTVSSIVCWVAFYWKGLPGEVDTFSLIVFAFAFLSIPIAASINLGVESGLTNKLLRHKLAEVKILSQRTIDQEKEKQQILENQKEILETEVTERTHELQESLENLKSTQTQLIHAEKMASLGELTAGIAHEIQNPLNFVNNFSEVSKELIEELKGERLKVKAEKDEALEEELLDNVVQNLEKINHHGQRASDIVKSMLQHSRTGSNQREHVDINKLADEYLRLAYHGFRAKDKSFDAQFKTELDPSLPKVNVVAQDIGRVLLNLINNAFYVVSEKSKRGVEGYEPTVTVRTKRINHSIEIRVKDNGDGIPANVINKIFQPFFTTKPTGEGTGLGLSLSYDIITKGHNGSLEVDTTEGVGTEFIVQLPVV